MTFLQFLFIAIDGFLFTSKCGTAQRRVDIKSYMVLVFMFFVSSVLNNYAFNFNIPMPLHMIFRAVRRQQCIKVYCIIFKYTNLFIIIGFSDSKHDYGYYYFKEKIYHG